jgi:branched-chain amino acid transport system substrate-binding protein
MRMKTKFAATLAVALVAAGVIAGCGGGSSSGGQEGGGTYSVGLLTALSGPTAVLGEDIQTGFEIGLEDASDSEYTFKPNVANEGDGTQAGTAVQAARSLVSGGTKNIAGPLLTTDCAAVAPVVDGLGGTTVSTTCSEDGLFEPTPVAPSFFGVAAGDYAYDAALGAALGKEFPKLTKLAVFGWDYPPGHDQPPNVQRALAEQGVKAELNPQTFVPITEANYRTPISKMAGELASGNAEEQGLLAVVAGASTTTLLQQSKAFGLENDVAFMAAAAESSLGLAPLKGQFGEFWYSYDYFRDQSESKANKAFIEAYEQKAGKLPAGYAWQGYAAASAIATAIKEAGSDEPAKVQEELTKVSTPTPTGAFKIDPTTHRMLHPVTVVHVKGNPSAPEGIELIKAYEVESGKAAG